jgi:parvulin-like peptidyl-prolyl isomerase
VRRLALLLVVGLASTARGDAPNGAVAVLDRPVAFVGGVAIWQSEVDDKLFGQAPSKASTDQALDTLIDELIYIARAKELYIIVGKSEVLAALDEIKLQNNLDDAGLDAALKTQGYTRARYMVDLERQLLILRVRNADVGAKTIVRDSDVDAEAKTRGMKTPLADAEKKQLHDELYRKRMEVASTAWLAGLKKHVHIERRP